MSRTRTKGPRRRALSSTTLAGLTAFAAAALPAGSWGTVDDTAPVSRVPTAASHESVAQVVAIDVGDIPTDVVATPTAVWVATGLGGIVRIDPRVNAPVARIRPGGAVTKLAHGLGAIWALDLFGDRLLRIDPRSNRVIRAIRVDGLPSGLVIGHGLVWVASQLESTVAGIDPRTGVVVKRARFARGELWPGGLAAGPEGVWVITGNGNEVSLFDTETMAFRHRTRVAGARTLVVTGRSAWVGLAWGGSMIRIRDGRVLRTDSAVPADGYGPRLAAADRVWVGSQRTVAALDPSTGAVAKRVWLPKRYAIAAIAAGRNVWVVDADRAVLLRLSGDRRAREAGEAFVPEDPTSPKGA